MLDPLFLARVQFAFTISFHIVFPALTIGFASFLALLEGLYLKTEDSRYLNLYKLWIKVFAIAFGMGVVSGLVMSYQFGTNWSSFADHVGNVIGPLLGYEVLTAFFLEASFLGIMLFGWGRVSRRMHFTSTCIVAVGTLVSAFWILSANSWMQTPAGYTLLPDGRFFPANWIDIIFNPSFGYRLFHMIVAAYLSTICVIGGVGAFYLIKKRFQEEAKVMLKIATVALAILAPTQLFLGDLHGLNTLEHQPLKVAAMEGIWETESGAGLRLFASIDEHNEKNNFEIAIPKLASWILTHKSDGTVRGIKEWPKEERPPVAVVFWSFRIMVLIGFAMIGLGLLSALQLRRKKLFDSAFLLQFWKWMLPSGLIALLAGWFVTEVGRQPYCVYGVLTTAKSVSHAILGPQVAWSLLAFVIIYTIVFGAGVMYMYQVIQKGIVTTHEPLSPPTNAGLEATIIKASLARQTQTIDGE